MGTEGMTNSPLFKTTHSLLRISTLAGKNVFISIVMATGKRSPAVMSKLHKPLSVEKQFINPRAWTAGRHCRPEDQEL